MSKKRYIDTRFWNDNFIVELDPLERYLFLYFLTNEHTNISGIYELPMRVMAFETGLDKEMLEKMILRFEPRVLYIDNWVCLTNFLKHQSLSNMKIRAGIEENLKAVSQEIIDKVIGYGYPIDSVSRAIIYSNRDSNTNRDSNSNGKEEELFTSFWNEYPKKVGKVVAEKAFKHLSLSKELVKTILEDIRQRKEGDDWQKDEGKFIPYPATYLNQRRWEDETKPQEEVEEPEYYKKYKKD